MPRKTPSTPRDRDGERIAVLETSHKHLAEKQDLTVKGLESLTDAVQKIQHQFHELTTSLKSYGRSGLMLAAAAVLSASGPEAAKAVLAGLGWALKVVSKLPV